MNYNTPTDRLLQILVTLGQSGEAISAKELSEQLSQPLSSTYRHLKTLLRWVWPKKTVRAAICRGRPVCSWPRSSIVKPCW